MEEITYRCLQRSVCLSLSLYLSVFSSVLGVVFTICQSDRHTPVLTVNKCQQSPSSLAGWCVDA